MKSWILTALVAASVLGLLALAFLLGSTETDLVSKPAWPDAVHSQAHSNDTSTAAPQGFLYGRVTTDDGAVYEGRLRFGTNEEAFWDDSFNGYKAANPWADFVPPEQLTERVPIEIFGVEIASRTRQIDLDRPFMVRFGDVSRIDVDGRDLRVTLRSGAVFDLDRFNADDIADGLRVWDAERGVVDLVEWQIRSIEFLPTPELHTLPTRLYGTVRTADATFEGFVQWNRESCVRSDLLVGQTTAGEVREVGLRFDAIRSITRTSPDSVRVRLLDGPDIKLSGTRAVGEGHRGVHVEDPRFGRVLVPWGAFESLDFRPAPNSGLGSGPGYDDLPPSRPLAGTVTTRDGRSLTGRLVYDLDESETAETLDAPRGGVNYSIPFRRIASIRPIEDRGGRVTLDGGEELLLDRRGDLGDGNAGLLVFVAEADRPVYVLWSEVHLIEF